MSILPMWLCMYVFQETIEKQLCDPQVLTPDFSKPEVSD